jgi:hypothetical protein
MLVATIRRKTLQPQTKITPKNASYAKSIKPNEPLLITKSINSCGQAWQRFMNGLPDDQKSEVEKNRERMRLHYDVLQVQQLFFEDLHGSNSQRFTYLSHTDENLIRFDNNPKSDIAFRKNPYDKNQDLIWIEGILKSHLNEKGQLVPVSQLPMDVFFESHPKTLANLAYQHVMSTNKNRFSINVEKKLSKEKIEEILLPEVEKLHKKSKPGSPMTSTTKNPPMHEKLAEWGAAGERIEISTDQLKVLPSSRLVYLIMHHANFDGIDEPSKKKWREDKGCFASTDCEAVKIMEAKLKEVGVDPDGPWTKREVAVFYALVADEHMLIGTTPEGSAKIVEHKKSPSDAI